MQVRDKVRSVQLDRFALGFFRLLVVGDGGEDLIPVLQQNGFKDRPLHIELGCYGHRARYSRTKDFVDLRCLEPGTDG